MVEYSAAALDAVFQALSDATRRGILQQLTGVERTVGEIA
jgi:DNA-binding transcriptional ArsR family regulator